MYCCTEIETTTIFKKKMKMKIKLNVKAVKEKKSLLSDMIPGLIESTCDIDL